MLLVVTSDHVGDFGSKTRRCEQSSKLGGQLPANSGTEGSRRPKSCRLNSTRTLTEAVTALPFRIAGRNFHRLTASTAFSSSPNPSGRTTDTDIGAPSG